MVKILNDFTFFLQDLALSLERWLSMSDAWQLTTVIQAPGGLAPFAGLFGIQSASGPYQLMQKCPHTHK